MSDVTPLPPIGVDETTADALLRGICERLDRVWNIEHANEIDAKAAGEALEAANAQIQQYADELADKGLFELARQVQGLVQ